MGIQAGPLHVIVNPAAARGKGLGIGSRVAATLRQGGWRVETEVTRAPGDAVRLARAAVLNRAHRLVVVGGDGTVHEVAQGLLDTPSDALPPVVVCPVGTGNDFYRMIGPRGGLDRVAELLNEGQVAHFDIGRVRWDGGERVFMNLMGVGVDVEVLRCRARFSRLPGLLQYLAAFLNAVAVFRAPDMRVEAGTHTAGGETLLCVITVGPSIGGGFMINPGATPLDGKLDLCHVQHARLPSILKLVPQVLRGAHAASDLVTMRQLEHAVVRHSGGEALWFELDGELMPQPARELHVTVEPGAFPVVVPNNA